MIEESLFQHLVELRRKIHRHPEIGFDLPETTALVLKELDALGIPHTEQYAPSSSVAFIGNDPAKKTLAIRADMDALPVEEKVDLPYKSEIPGRMHACGHDTHTAILLGLARLLKEREKELPVNVRLFFQPSEECEESGAKTMTDNGAMEGVDLIVCTHCEPFMNVGDIGVASGDYMAACMPLTFRFFGKTSHAAAAPELGIDAIKMAHEAYPLLYSAARETFGDKKYVFSVGTVHGGTAHNVIADHCEMVATFRYFDQKTADEFKERASSILAGIAAKYGGKAEVEGVISSHPTYNDPALVEEFRQIMKKEPEVRLLTLGSRMSSEDFNWYLQKAPGFIFRYGIRTSEDADASPAHSNTFRVDENGMKYALLTFMDYVFALKG